MKNHWQSDLDSMKKMENIQKKKQMVIPRNLHSQLRVLDSSQQLYAPLFLASYCSSTNTLSLKTLRKTPPFLHNALLFFFPFLFSHFPVYATLLPSYSPVSKHGLPQPLSLLLHAFFPHHSFCSHLFFSLIHAPWRPAGPHSRKFLHVSKSYCNFKKRGWFLMATKDVTRGPLG